MLKHTIKFVDFDEVEREEDFYFNLTKSELIKLNASEEGTLQAKLEKIMKSPNGKDIMKYFNEIIMVSYGEKSEDGRRFIKSPELSKAFSETPAYDELFMELVTDAEKAAAFVNGVVPKL